MKVTSIKQQIKNPQRVSIFVDGKYSFSLSLDELVTHKLKNDIELSTTDVKKFKKISADGKLRARALEWLLNRPHSIREFRDYLFRKKAEPEMTDTLIKEYSDRGYLDEKKFAQWLIDFLKRHGKSNRAIRAELFKKGISRELVDQAMAGGEEDEDDRLRTIIDKKRKLPRYQKDSQKLAQYLVQQGFSWQDVKTALKINRPE